MISKDFYPLIPTFVKRKLDMKISLYQDEAWFEGAWMKYRQACLSAGRMRDIPDPDVFFAVEERNLSEMKASIDDGITFSADDLDILEQLEIESKEEIVNEEDLNLDIKPLESNSKPKYGNSKKRKRH